MQVTHVNDHVTHAVIGGNAPIEVGISNSAEFFHIFSSTLYKDQILAVIREVLCNAWDAHIEAGCTDKAVEILLTPEKFIIRDFGKGIHRDDIGPIYGVIGNSTKKNDGKQTGGFGLGCKAPWAYNDHFEVQSNHDGVKTIYNLSKSNAQAMGKPAIIPIASVPTTETGLQVSISIKNTTDFHRFTLLVKRIVRNGDMNMTLNGVALPKLGFDASKSSYFITQSNDLMDAKVPMMLRYGNVIYPIEKSAEIAEEYMAVERFLERLKAHYQPYRIVFQAPPHSITVQPSREGLSMQEHTIKTLKTLMNDFLAITKGKFLVECDKIVVEVIDEAVKEADIPELLKPTAKLPSVGHREMVPDVITDLGVMAQRYMYQNYPSDLAFRKRDITYRLTSMVKAGLLERGLTGTYLRAMKQVKSNNGHMQRESSDWLQRQVLAPLIMKMKQADMNWMNLSVFDSSDTNAPRGVYGKDIPPLVPAIRARPRHLFNAMPYLRNIVVLAHTKTKIMDRCRQHDVFKEMGAEHGFLFYYTGLKKADKEQAIEFFQKTGMVVVDLTYRQDWEIEEVPAHYVAAPRKPPKVGIAKLSCVQHHHGGLDTSLLLEDDAERTTEPEFVLNVSLRSDVSKNRIEPLGVGASQDFVSLFGEKGGITNNSATYAKWIAKGAKPFEQYMFDKLEHFFQTNANVREYWAYHPDRVMAAADFSSAVPESVFRLIYKLPTLRKLFKLQNNLTPDEKKMLNIWESYMRDNRWPDKRAEKIQRDMGQIPLALTNLEPVMRFKHSKLISLFNASELFKVLNDKPEDSPEVQTAIRMLMMALR